MTVDKRSDDSAANIKGLPKIRALIGGTDAMREAKAAYLPRMEGETAEAYSSRLALSFLFNATRKTVRDMSGRVFDTPIKLNEDVPKQIEEWADNIDLAGRSLNVFAKDVFEDTLAAGISFILVDAPPRSPDTSKAAARALNLRPYMVHITSENLLGWKAKPGSPTELGQVRVMEYVKVDVDEFTEETVEQIRVLDATPSGVSVRLYRQNKKREFVLFDGPFQIGVDRICLAPVYGNRTGWMQGEPLLDDLADVNVAHWQSQSDQRNILKFARVPILHIAGVSSDETARLSLSSANAHTHSDPSAKMEWVEHSGAAIAAGRQDLKDLEFQMEALGLQLLVQRTSSQSATGEALDADKETSQLAMLARNLINGINRALQFMADFAGEPEGGTVDLNTDYGAGTITQAELNILLSAVNTGNMSRQTFLEEMQRRGVISADIDVDEEIERIADEGLTMPGDDGDE